MIAATSGANAGYAEALREGKEVQRSAPGGSSWPLWDALKRLLRSHLVQSPPVRWEPPARWERGPEQRLSVAKHGQGWSHVELQCLM